ncbi:hypothetical protein JYU20_04165, partial [Bacteroidales bacterium AH-315-I05]|nr:hypothetical protein [Bacteroidales bacterium AH-315-I05]
MKTVIYTFIMCFPVMIAAQDISNLREKFISTKLDSIKLDSLSIVPNSLILTIDSSFYIVDYAKAKLFWKQKPEEDSMKIIYHVFPFSFSKEFKHKDIEKIELDQSGMLNPFKYTVEKSNEGILEMKGLNKQGSISRGVSFGNNQDLSVNSNLNLQLSGKISDNINVLAAMTDDNIPIQPEGNTQQLQDFDQVYIQLFDEQNTLTAGDFQLRSKGSYFMKYFKKAKGGSFSTSFKTSKDPEKKDIMNAQISGAVSRGKFARYIKQGEEGNQGPYKLKGAENETFIIVLSGTERVFIDGELLIRGQENDYIIDYNMAEITFTAKRLITKDKRIVVEFQYTSQNYARSLVQFSNFYQNEKLKLNFNLYSEQDNKTRPIQYDLSDEQKQLLSNIGDNLDSAISDNFRQVEFSNDRVLYKLEVDSVSGDSIFIYSTNPDSAIYQVGFSNVGAKGNYKQLQSAANGKVFGWFPPDTVNGQLVPQGNYEPVISLITPKQKQMIVVSGEYKISENTLLSFESALSNNDLNKFSSKDVDDNIGYAVKFNFVNKTKIGSDEKKPLQVVTGVGYEQLEKNFSHIEWFRSAEFDRDWNIRNVELGETQHIPSASVSLRKAGVGNLATYGVDAFVTEKNEFNGYKNRLTSNFKTKKFDVDFIGSFMQSKGVVNNSEFLRNKARIARKFKWLTIGIRDDFENNQFKNVAADTLLANSYEFLEWEAFITSPDTFKNKFMVSYTQRTDKAAQNNSLQKATFGESIAFGFDLLKNPKSKLRGKTTYRTLKIEDETLTNDKPDNTLLNRLEYNLRLFKGAITSTSFYEIGSGLELKKEFSFLFVGDGLGNWEWIDYNNDSVQQLDEFEIINKPLLPDKGDYIKIFTPTNEFVKVFTNQFSQSLFLNPSAIWRNKKSFLKFVSRFSNQLAFRIDRKTNYEDIGSAYNPFLQEISDTFLVSLNKSFRNTFYFNRTDPKFGVNINYQDIQGKTLLTNGFESRTKTFTGGDIRWNMTRKFMLNLKGEQGKKTNISDFFSTRDYSITYQKVEPKMTFQPGTKFRASLLYEYMEKQNHDSLGGESTLNQKIGSEIRWNTVGKGSLQFTANYILIDFKNSDGTEASGNTSLAFEMLEGLQPGQNYTWTLSYQRTLANNLQLSLNYNGRKSE